MQEVRGIVRFTSPILLDGWIYASVEQGGTPLLQRTPTHEQISRYRVFNAFNILWID